jgi:HK97 family phage prohead protease
MEIKRAQVSTSSLDVETRSFDVVASTESIDSHGDIVKQSWRLERYEANPVVLLGHGGLPIGKGSNVRVEDGALKMRVTLVSEKANPQAEQVLQLMREDALKAVSVGFRPGRRSTEKRDGREVRVLDDNELLEVSVVAIGSNPDAQAKDHARHGAGALEAQNMNDITKALGLRTGASAEDVTAAFGAVEKEILEATGARKLAEVAAKVDALRVERDALKAAATELEAVKAKLAEEAKAAAAAKLQATLDDAVKAGRVTPARREELAQKAAKHGQEWLEELIAQLPVQGGSESEARSLAGPDTSAGAAARVVTDELRAELKRFGLTEADYVAVNAKKEI